MIFRIQLSAIGLLSLVATEAGAQDGGLFGWVRGDWYLTVGAAGFVAPRFEGDDSYLFNVSPLSRSARLDPRRASPRAMTTFPFR